jgi:hypothetical protein
MSWHGDQSFSGFGSRCGPGVHVLTRRSEFCRIWESPWTGFHVLTRRYEFCQTWESMWTRFHVLTWKTKSVAWLGMARREMRVRLHQKFNVSRTFGGSSQPNTNEGLIFFQNKEDESHFHTLSSFDYLQEWRKVKIMVNSIK